VIDCTVQSRASSSAPGREPGTRKLATALRGTGIVADWGNGSRRGFGAELPIRARSAIEIYNAAAIRTYAEKLGAQVEPSPSAESLLWFSAAIAASSWARSCLRPHARTAS